MESDAGADAEQVVEMNTPSPTPEESDESVLKATGKLKVGSPPGKEGKENDKNGAVEDDEDDDDTDMIGPQLPASGSEQEDRSAFGEMTEEEIAKICEEHERERQMEMEQMRDLSEQEQLELQAQAEAAEEQAPQNRIKLYELNDDGQWDDKGTGYVHINPVPIDETSRLTVRKEKEGQEGIDPGDEGEAMLDGLVLSPIEGVPPYQKQGETIICWSEPDGSADRALSFQDSEFASDIWLILQGAEYIFYESHFLFFYVETFSRSLNLLI